MANNPILSHLSTGVRVLYLKRIELIGFKSFANKTELEFSPGLTAVVGPNGSGKSNIADAIRWVLGEQSAKTLRGAKMEDVIFAGSDGRQPMGFAQVSIIFDNADRALPWDFNEVMLTRRVDRAGESEYLINQVPARLKDIQELLFDTGIGKENYSVVGQGRIDEILSTRPEDRRLIFEEAAGISRYKQRKREAQRRLNETELNLTRLADIVGELEGQVLTLAAQAEAAKQYRQLTEQISNLEISLSARSLADLEVAFTREADEATALKAALAQNETAKGEAEAGQEAAQALVEALANEGYLVGQQLLEATSSLERAQGEHRLALEQEGHNRLEQEQTEAAEAELAERQLALEAEAAALCRDLEQVGETEGRLAAQLTRDEAARLAEGQSRAQLSEALSEAREQLAQLAEAQATLERQVAAGQASRAEAEKRKQWLVGDLRSAEADEAQMRGHQADAEAQAEALRASIVKAEQDLHVQQALRHRLEAERAALVGEYNSNRERLGAQRSRLALLTEMARDFEGYQRGPRTVLKGKERGEAWAEGVVGAVAALVQIEPHLDRAIEVALGGGLQNLVTTTDAAAQAAIAHLKRVDGGRATFLPLNTVKPASLRPDEAAKLKTPGILGVALDLISYEPAVEAALANLLGRVVVAEDLDAAIAFGRATGMRLRVVTLEGELLSPGGALTGGSLTGRSGGLFARERERASLASQVAAAEGQLAELVAKGEAVAAQVQAALAAEEAAKGHLEAQKRQLMAQEAVAAGHAAQAARLAEAVKGAAAQLAALDQELAAAAQAVAAQQSELSAATAARSEAAAKVAALEGQEAAARAQQEVAAHAWTERSVQLATLRQQAEGYRERQRRLAAELAQLKGQRQAKGATLTRLKAEAVALASATGAAQAAAEAAEAARARCEAEQRRLSNERLKAQERLNELERQLRQLRREEGRLSQRLTEVTVALTRVDGSRAAEAERLAERHGLQPDEVRGRELPSAEVGEAKEQLSLLRSALEALGPVNLAAIDDHAQALERHTFLLQQQADLTEASASLTRAIAELDSRIKSLFSKAFKEVREAFIKSYKELFGGGTADLFLADPDDLLESGIEIVAQPPGKRLQHLSLLSGGERALTACALLFALLEVRPTPFVVLDEVEAALDEGNVERVGAYLQRLAQEGRQFIAITHQRGTMEVADHLYGVTMEGNGLSSIVSVRLTASGGVEATG